MKNSPTSPNGQDDISKNNSLNLSIEEIVEARLSRRTVLKGGLVVAAGSFFGLNFTGCGGDGVSLPAANVLLGFTPVAKNLNDTVSIPDTYSMKVLYKVGDPISNLVPSYNNDGTDTDFSLRAGDHHDGMFYFGMNTSGTSKDMNNSERGLLCMNHENITQLFLHTEAQATSYNVSSRLASQIDKEVSAHGISVIEIQKGNSGFALNKSSTFNKRITASTPMDINGPVRGNDLVKTKYSTNGTATRGTLNNCASGLTPWGTYLTCEENWAGYFKRAASSTLDAKSKATQDRYMGSSANNGSYGWANSTTTNDIYDRWNTTPTGATGVDDYRNVANTFGWVVEIDPFNPTSTPRKRTAMGRMGHEGAMPGIVTNGKPLVYYMGDDARNEYIYKYVSNQNWNEDDATANGLDIGDKYLDSGKLYVAKFSDTGIGEWILLSTSNSTIASNATYIFADMGDLLVNIRIAADIVGATPMDRPEWTGVNPLTGDVYITLTNNSQRGKAPYDGSGFGASETFGLNAANPRYYTDIKGTETQKGNVNGHIIRLKETDNNGAATTFSWDIYLFGAEADSASTINISSLTDENDFSSPDGLFFSQATKGLMWLQTDDGAYTDETNCMMLAALPGSYGDGSNVSIVNNSVPSNGNTNQTVSTFKGKNASTTNLKRFLVGPKGCEITGIAETPDGKTIFVNIQHPGENTTSLTNPSSFESHWPDGGTSRPRSATIVITKNDGGVIAE